MRLLNVHGLNFKEFYSDVPKYVILSHRWAEGSEVTLQDVQNGLNTDKSGYRKVRCFADYVKQNYSGIDWIWVDTCCINKSDAAELSESINSMFKWYRKAEFCLAYLPDVNNAEDLDGFAESDWYTRGWTLQELLAPHLVVFLTCDWKVVGHKGSAGNTYSEDNLLIGPSLVTIISRRTAVPENVLEDYNASHFIGVKSNCNG